MLSNVSFIMENYWLIKNLDFRHRLAAMPSFTARLSNSTNTEEDPVIKEYAEETGRGILERLEDPE